MHRSRRCQLLATHPEIRGLIGTEPATILWIVAVGSLQLTIAALLADKSLWLALLAAYVFGALISLALWTLIHETTHDLVFRNKRANKVLGIAAGLPLIVPAAASFRKYHLLHHRHSGDPILDGDVPSAWELRLIRTSRSSRALWLFLMPLMQCLRPLRMKDERLLDPWLLANIALQLTFNTALVIAFGWTAFAYLLAANVFSLGLHPLGGRWLQEHLGQPAGQPTSSYYGLLNLVTFNAGHHVEHHDIAYIPWTRLPHLRAIAPEFYSGLQSHRMWSLLVFRFLLERDPQIQWNEPAPVPASPAMETIQP